MSQQTEIETVADLIEKHGMSFNQFEERSGLEGRILRAIIGQRYTPSPDQREKVARVLGVQREQIHWGHATPVEAEIHAPI